MKNGTKLFLQEVLDSKRLALLEKFKKIKEKGFYLAGGTALALIFGHRESIDFDFFVKGNFDENKLFGEILEIFKGENVKKIFSEKNTLYVEVNGVKISFFGYNYDLVGDLMQTEYFNIANIEDIGAMKLWAIQKRATNKDYIDLYYILQKISLKELIDIFYKKYGNVISGSILLKSLVYFDDIVEENLIIKDKNLNFEKVKDYLIKVVKDFENI